MPIKLEGHSLILRPHRKTDAPALVLRLNDEAVSRYTTIPYPYSLEDALDYLKLTAARRRKKLIVNYDFALELKSPQALIGGLGLMGLDRQNRNAELGYWLAQEFWGRGLMQEAIKLALEFSFGALGLVRVYARVAAPNLASRRCIERAGFELEGVSRKALLDRRGEWLDFYNYARLA